MSEDQAVAAPSAGVLLRRAREAAGLHVAALAVSLKVPVRKVEALEGDRYDLLPDAVFARALASSICRTLKIDPQPVLERLPQGNVPRLVQDGEGINAPFRAPGDVAAPGWRDHLARPVTLAVAALLVGALVIVFLPSLRRDEGAVAKADTAAVPMAAAVVVEPAPPTDPPAPGAAPAVPAAAPTAAAGPEVTAAPKAPAAVPADAPVAAAVAAPVPASPATAASAPTTAPGPTDGLIVFRTSGPSWVEVVDSQGRVPLRRLLAAGETAGASGSLPLAVTVGSASTTAVEVRGRRFDLSSLVRDNVARFEVK